MARPDPRKKLRRFTDVSAIFDKRLVRWGRLATPLVFFLNIVFSLANADNVSFAGMFFKAVGRHATIGLVSTSP